MSTDLKFRAEFDVSEALAKVEGLGQAMVKIGEGIAQSNAAQREETRLHREALSVQREKERAAREAARLEVEASRARQREVRAESAAMEEMYRARRVAQEQALQADRTAQRVSVERKLAQIDLLKHEAGLDSWERAQRAASLREQRGLAEASREEGWGAKLGGVGMMALGALGLGSVTAAVMTLVNTLQGRSDGLAAAGGRAEQASVGAREFLVSNTGAEGRAFAQASMKTGSELGLTADQTGAIGMTLKAATDKDGDNRLNEAEQKAYDEGLRTAGKMTHMGVQAEDAQKVVGAAFGRGMTVREMANTMMIAAEDSASLGPGDTARLLSSTAQYSTAQMGFAAGVGIGETEKNPGRVDEKVRALQRAVGPGANKSKLSKRFGLTADMNELERIEAIAQRMIEDGDQSLSEDERVAQGAASLADPKYGLDIQQQEALSMALKARGKMRTTYDKMMSVPQEQNLVNEKFASMMDDPNIRSDFEAKQLAARLQYDQMYGKELGPQARAEKEARRREGEALQSIGDVARVDQTTGETNQGWLGRFGYSVFGGAAVAVNNFGRRLHGQKEFIDNPWTERVEGNLQLDGNFKRRRGLEAVQADEAGALGAGPVAALGGLSPQLEQLNTNLTTLNSTLERNNTATEESTRVGGAEFGAVGVGINRNGNI